MFSLSSGSPSYIGKAGVGVGVIVGWGVAVAGVGGGLAVAVGVALGWGLLVGLTSNVGAGDREGVAVADGG